MCAETSRRLVLDADLDRLGEARAWLREHAQAAGFSGKALGELELAVTEAISNVVRHGYDGRAGETVELVVDVDEEALVLRILDSGELFDPLAVDVDVSEPRSGGYGIHLIRTVADELTWRPRGERGNELRLVRRRPAE